MFHHDTQENHYLDIGHDAARNLTPTIPAGVYRFGRSMAGNYLAVQDTGMDRYVDVPDPAMSAVISELREFFDPVTRTRMTGHGILNKRGVLLWGPHGTGKTRLMQRIAEVAVGHGAVVLNGPDPDDDLTDAVTAIRRDDRERDVVVMWDEFDRTTRRYEYPLLRWLDGVDSVPNIMFVGCTNDISAIPTRIYARPSRFGLVQRIGPVTVEARTVFLQGMFPELDGGAAQELARLTDGMSLDLTKEVALLHLIRGYTPAQIMARLKATEQDLNGAGVSLELGVDWGSTAGSEVEPPQPTPDQHPSPAAIRTVTTTPLTFSSGSDRAAHRAADAALQAARAADAVDEAR